MKLMIVVVCCLSATALFAQSKKELQAEINRLQSQVAELKRLNEVDLTDSSKRISYCVGVMLAANIQSQDLGYVNTNALMSAIQDVLNKKSPKIPLEEAQLLVQQYMQKSIEMKTQKTKEEGQVFLNENKSKEGVKTTASGLQYKVISEGSGKSPGPSDRVTVHYTGKLIDGTVFDSSVKRGQPATFGVNQVISGWTEALQLMKEGDRWIIYLPYNLAYGERGAGGQIPPYATLIFEVELIKVN